MEKNVRTNSSFSWNRYAQRTPNRWLEFIEK